MITDKNTCFNISGEMMSKWKMCNEPVWGFPSGSVGKKSTWVQFLYQEDHLEKEMETHFSILAWEIQ